MTRRKKVEAELRRLGLNTAAHAAWVERLIAGDAARAEREDDLKARLKAVRGLTARLVRLNEGLDNEWTAVGHATDLRRKNWRRP